MSEPSVCESIKSSPKTIYLDDYQLPNYFIDEVLLDFDLQDEYTIVKSHLRVRHNRLSQNASHDLVLDGEALVLESIKLNGETLNPSHYHKTDQALIIHNVPNHFELEIITKIFPKKNTALSGLYCSKNKYCTQCEAEGFRRITYFLDHPDVLSRFTTTITADETVYPFLLSNGNLIASGKLENGRHWVKWEDPYKKPSYLFALVAGDFDVVEDRFVTQSARDVAIKLYVDKGYGSQVGHAIYSLKEAMRWDELTYGREYDLDIYMIVAIGDFNMGAMENKGLNIFNTKYILAKPETATDDDYIHILSVIGHEYFHNWSGNRVTCRDWFQLSLKEGLTIFRDQSFTQDMLSPAVVRIQEVTSLRESQFPEDASPLAHPVRPDSYIEINNFYTSTIYNKGAEVLRMLQTILGRQLFRKGMDLYFARHDGQAVTIEDYIKTMEDVSGIDLQQFRLWYSQAGTPVVTITDDYDPSQKVYTITAHQTCPPTPGQPEKKPMVIPISIGLLDQLGEELSIENNLLLLTKATQSFQFKNIKAKPVPSFLRHFSAPIILNYDYADADLLFLFKHDQDLFNRYEAGQKYALKVILNLIRDYQQQKSLKVPQEMLKSFADLLTHSLSDKYLMATMLTLPSEKYIGEQMAVIDVEAIHVVREFILNELAQSLEPLLKQAYLANQDNTPYQFNMEAVGKRQLKNRCLLYLSLLPQYADLVMEQFEKSLQHNMTDTQAAFVALSNMDSPLREKALEKFYCEWKDDALVVDKWLSIQAATKLPIALQQIKKLMRHEAFDIKNPNKVYALIGTFGYRNPMAFHAESGEGYAFLRDTVQQLDKLNPQVASRMVKPLTMWQRYNEDRQALMRKQLEILFNDSKLSPDMYEMVSKSLMTHGSP